MKETIFDLIPAEIGDGKEGYFDLASNAPEPKEKSFLSDIKDYGKTFLKGSIEGLSKLGTMMGPTGSSITNASEEHEKQTQVLDELLPTDEEFAQKGLRRGLNMAPSAAASPFGGPIQAVIRSGIAGYAGQGAEELKAPEWLQTAAELTAFVGPDITKKLLEKGSNKEIIEAARKIGISDEALTPLLQSDTKQKWLTKLTPRRGKTQEALGKSKSELQESYGKISKSFSENKTISTESTEKLIASIDDKLFKMPSGVRSKIKTDFDDLLNKPITGESIINFWTDINHELGKNTKQLSLLKEPLKEALKEISPEMAKDFEIINSLYSKFFPIAKRLEPNLQTDIMGAAKSLGLLGGIITGNYGLIAKTAPPYAWGKISQQMLLNPRFQQLTEKMVSAINENKITIAKKVVDLIAKEIRKISNESADEIENISEKELMDLFSSHQKSKNKPQQ